MSFWDLSTGETTKAEAEYEAPSGGGVIPDDTDVMAFIDEIKWDSKEENKYISARWRITKPEAFKNRVVFSKLWVLGNDPNAKDPEKRKKKGDAAKRMLAAIDANAGGELMTINGIPSDEDLQRCLMQKMMVIKLKVWEMTGNDGAKMEGNWICAVSPKTKGVSENVQAVAKKAAATSSAKIDDDEIPF